VTSSTKPKIPPIITPANALPNNPFFEAFTEAGACVGAAVGDILLMVGVVVVIDRPVSVDNVLINELDVAAVDMAN
jgi:hypothetical protein